MNKKVEIYSSPSCHFCIDLKEFLKENGIEYIEHDISSDENTRKELVERSSQTGVPVVFINDIDIIIGFDKDKLKEKLEI